MLSKALRGGGATPSGGGVRSKLGAGVVGVARSTSLTGSKRGGGGGLKVKRPFGM